MTDKKRALVLLSGGLDSCVAAAMAQEEGLELVVALNVLYAQKNEREKISFLQVAAHYQMEVASMDISQIAKHIGHATALINPNEELPKNRKMSEMATAGVPRSYVPGRNTIMLAFAQSIAEARDLDVIVTGIHATDSAQPDTRQTFINAWNNLARYATKKAYEQDQPIEVLVPVIAMSKASIVFHGNRLKAPIGLTWSCYQGGEKACGVCDACIIRWNAFLVNGLKDPIGYEVEPDSIRAEAS